MKIIVAVLGVFLVVSVIINYFLGTEMLKKFKYFNGYIKSDVSRVVSWYYPGAKSGKTQNIVLRADRPFSALVGFDLTLPGGYQGFDYYGFVSSGSKNIIVISTFLGTGPCNFKFVTTTNVRVTVSVSEEDQDLKPDVAYPPHWWQRLL